MKCFVDMDGVLADFVGGACRAHRRPSPYLSPDGLGKFDMELLWGISPEEFWAPTNSVEFWLELDKTPEADSIMRAAMHAYGQENIAILTAPSLFDGCIGAKRAWIKKQYPFLSRRIIFAASKEFMAGPNCVLVDDRDKNVDVFRAHGGFAVLVPRLWNRDHALADSTTRIVQQRLGII